MDLTTTTTTRRDALKIGGITVSLGAFIAACGENVGGSDDPGRVGNAPLVEALPEYAVNDAVLLRTASSLEYTAIATYEAALGLEGAIPADVVPMVERLIEDHTATAETMVELTTAAGGEPWECPNEWFMERLVTPVLEAIQSPVIGIVLGDDLENRIQIQGEQLDVEAGQVTTSIGILTVVDEIEVDNGKITSVNGEPVSEGDEVRFVRAEGAVPADVLAFANALESFAAASHQELVSAISVDNVDARIAHAEAAALEARHAAALSIAVGGPDAYIAPELLGDEASPSADGQLPQFAIGSTFGLTSQIEIKAGPADLNAVRVSYLLQTPSDNSFVYEELEPSCSA